MLKPFSYLFLLFRKGVGGVGPGHDGLTGPWAEFLGAKNDCSGREKRIGGNFPQGSYWFPVCISPKNPDTSPEVVSRTKLAPIDFIHGPWPGLAILAGANFPWGRRYVVNTYPLRH